MHIIKFGESIIYGQILWTTAAVMQPVKTCDIEDSIKVTDTNFLLSNSFIKCKGKNHCDVIANVIVASLVVAVFTLSSSLPGQQHVFCICSRQIPRRRRKTLTFWYSFTFNGQCVWLTGFSLPQSFINLKTHNDLIIRKSVALFGIYLTLSKL